MDEFITNVLKFMSHTVVVQIYSFPHFSLEVLLAGMTCVVYCLLIFEVNNIVCNNEFISRTKLKIRVPVKDVDTTSIQSLIIQHDPVKQIESRINSPYRRRKFSTTSGISVTPPNEFVHSIETRFCYDRIEQILSITPSEYIRKDKEKRGKEHGIKTCIHSLTSLLESSLQRETLCLGKLSKENLKKNIFDLREYEKTGTPPLSYNHGDYQSKSYQSLLSGSSDKRPTFLNRYPFDEINMSRLIKESQDHDIRDGDSDYLRNDCVEQVAEKICAEFEQLCNENTISIIPCGLGDASCAILAN